MLPGFGKSLIFKKVTITYSPLARSFDGRGEEGGGGGVEQQRGDVMSAAGTSLGLFAPENFLKS